METQSQPSKEMQQAISKIYYRMQQSIEEIKATIEKAFTEMIDEKLKSK